jgi:hypothetical protein
MRLLDLGNSRSQVLAYTENLRRKAEFIESAQILFESIQQYRIALVFVLHRYSRLHMSIGVYDRVHSVAARGGDLKRPAPLVP